MKLALVEITGIEQDSRNVSPGDCFIAVTGLETDGRQYISAAIESGAVAVIEEGDGAAPISIVWQQLPIIRVPNLLQRISLLAGNFYRQPSRDLSLIGVTGTNGKTSCSQLLAQLLSRLQSPSAMIGTMGYGMVAKDGVCDFSETGMTTPDAVRSQKITSSLLAAGAQSAVLEVSSHALTQGRVASLAFDQAIFTNLSRDHLDYHGDMASYGEAKAKLFEFAGLNSAVINIDDEFGQDLAARARSYPVFSYAVNNPNADVYFSSVEYRVDGLRARLNSPWGAADVSTHLLGGFNLYNLLAVVTAACAKGYDFDAVIAQLEKLRPVAGRMQLLSSPHDAEKQITVIVDYAHTPDALNKALQAVKQHCSGKTWCVFGCGGNRDKGKRPLMMVEALRQADHVIVTSDNPRHENPDRIIDDVFEGHVESANADAYIGRQSDRRRAINEVIGLACDGDSILIAGKGHETYQLVADERLIFDDVKVVSEALAGLRVGL
jgi:UDP-N-acetylmuramoyl-L-alanyl-D-glutamate--2,6-diaminopimelate ligase